jgi:hypothetical protein
VKISIDDASSIIEESEDSDCKGLVFRARPSSYISSRGDLVYQERMVLMKRMSCAGCPACWWMWDDLSDFMSICEFPEFEKGIVDQALYRLDIVREHRDWETGIVDDYDFGFIRVEETK